MNDSLLILVGPTGIGKTELALGLAEKFGAEIIGADSMQIFRYMDIGTAKPTAAERARVPHHLVDCVDPAEQYTAGRFISDALAAIEVIKGRGRVPFLVGGTGLYIKGLLEGLFEDPTGTPGDQRVSEIRERLKQRLASRGREVLFEELQHNDPVSAARIHPNDTQRLLRALEIFEATGIPWSHHLTIRNPKNVGVPRHILKLGLTCDRQELYERINGRVDRMLQQGLQQEVEALLARGYDSGLQSMQSIGYRHMVNYLANEWPWDQMVELLARDTRRYAKRQFTWFKKDPEIQWFRSDQEQEVFAMVSSFLAESPPKNIPAE